METIPYIPKLVTMADKILTFTCNSALRKCVHPLYCTKMSYLRENCLRPLVLSGDMLRDRGLVLLTMFNFLYQISKEQIINTNGWIPMSHNDIYNQIRRNTLHTIKLPDNLVYLTMKPPMVYNNNLQQRQTNSKKEFRNLKESFEEKNEKSVETVIVANKTDNSDQTIVNSKENTRAKGVWNHDIDISDDNNRQLHEIQSKTRVANEENTIDNVITVRATPKAYKVTEDSDISTATEDNYTTENLGYQYNPPTNENQNLSSTLYKILSKYNINSEDKLQNYDLSLQRQVQNPTSSAYRIPLPYGYNNLNHLPVDPLLAVFLSNYGFYLPSLYGIKANYNNLYGYLASNNIHNNKPFGLYKVFSDTDSWY